MVAFYGLTDVGRRRPLNEDSLYAQDGLFVVCDGMGGHKAGEIASQLAVDAIAAFVKRSAADPEMTWPYGYDTGISYDANRLSTAIKLANRVVFRKAASADDYTGMGTTVAAVIIPPNRARMTYAHVGDSRINLIRAGVMLQLTRDDTWANLVDLDPAPSMKNVLTKALGAREDVDFAVEDRALQEGDIILMCSDGLTNMLSDARILETVLACGTDVERACQELISRANAEGGRDNITVILVRYSA